MGLSISASLISFFSFYRSSFILHSINRIFEDCPMLLKNISLFQGLSEAELKEIKNCLRERSFQKGDILFHEGECCDRIFIVQTGAIKLYRTSSSGREQILETLEKGDTCACNPGSSSWNCSTSAEAMTFSRVWFLSRADYIRMVRTHSKISYALNRLFAERLSRFSVLIEEVSLKDARKRLIRFLLDMHNQNAKTDSIHISFTREELAQRLGTARETIARHLYQLKRARLIDIAVHEIVICNKAGLEKLLQ